VNIKVHMLSSVSTDCGTDEMVNLSNTLLSQAWYTTDANWYDLPRFILTPVAKENPYEFKFQTDGTFLVGIFKDTKPRRTGEWKYEGGNAVTTEYRCDGIVYKTRYEALLSETGACTLTAVIPQKRRDDHI
jgi:hypothetical protein